MEMVTKHPSEKTPLREKEDNHTGCVTCSCTSEQERICKVQVQPTWKVWQPTSSAHRFFLLVFISLIPFGGHFVKNGMSSLEQLMLDDKDFPITNTMYGALVSAVSIPNMFIPFFGGHVLDRKGHSSILLFLTWMCIGQSIFAYGMEIHSFWIAMVGRIVFGIGEGSVVVGARVIVSHWFDNSELTFAMGAMVAITNLSKMIAKATSAPVALYFGSYVYAFWYGVVVCFFSFLFALVVTNSTRKLKKIIKKQIKSGAPLQKEMQWMKGYCTMKRKRDKLIKSALMTKKLSWKSMADFNALFWLVVVLHVVFINVFHLFQNISASYLYQVHGYSIVNAGYISSFSHLLVILAPFVGLAIDCIGGRMPLMILSSVLSILAYSLLMFSNVPPIVSMLLISLCLSFTPTILMASIPLTIPKNRFGVAFGIVEVVDAIGSSAGNIVIGYLRDETGSYTADLFLLLGLAVTALILCIALLVKDKATGGYLAVATIRARTLSVDGESSIVDVGTQFDTSSGDESSQRGSLV